MANQLTDTDRPLMNVKLFAPFRTYFNDKAYSISGVNDTGPFDILPRHHNFMSLLKQGELVVRAPGGKLKVKISRGVMHVKDDSVTVFLDV